MPFRDDNRIAFLQEADEATAIFGKHMESCLPSHLSIVCAASAGNLIPMPATKLHFGSDGQTFTLMPCHAINYSRITYEKP